MFVQVEAGGMVRRERADCTVSALSHAANIPYEVAYEIARAAGRRAGGTANGLSVVAAAKRYGIKLRKIAMRRRTLRKFLAFKPEGRFIAATSHHWLSVINGQPGDRTKLGAIVLDAWEVIV